MPNGMELKNYLFGGSTRQLVYKALDANMTRSRAVANNIANVNTPGYRRVEVSFEDQVKEALKLKLQGSRTDNDHLDIGRQAALKNVMPQTYLPEDPTLPGEINNVDIDLENAKMAENQLQYQFHIQYAGFGKYMSAIKGQPG